jgi:serine protease
LFFAPFLLPRHFPVIDWLARPIGDWDLLVSANLHGYLPLANALIPFALVLLFLSIRRLIPALAGFSVGTAAYLCSVALLRDVTSPAGTLALTLWCGLNAAACYWLARLVIAPRNAD